MILRKCGFGLNLNTVSGYFPHFSTVSGCIPLLNRYAYGYGRKVARLTNTGTEKVRSFGYLTTSNEPFSWESLTKSCYFVSVSSSSGEFLIQHNSGLCVGYDDKNNQLILTIKCTVQFVLTKDFYLKHVQTGMCVVPENNGTNNATIRLSFDCFQQQFYQDERFSLMYARSGRYIQPYLGNKWPIIGTRLVTNERFDVDITQLKFMFGKIEKYFNYNLYGIVWIQEASTVMSHSH